MEDVIRMFRESLLSAFRDWLEKNKETVGDIWYDELMRKVEEVDADTAIKIMGTSLWMFSMIADLGVLAGIGPNNVDIQGLRPGLDELSTRRLLMIISSCMNLQYLPKEIATKPIPIINAKQFSLKLFIQH